MNIDMDFDLKNVFFTEHKYNNIKLLESSIFETAICIKLEILSHDKKNELIDELNIINKFFEFYNKFIAYEFCKNNMNTKFQFVLDEDNKLLKDTDLTELFQVLFEKIDLVVDDLMGEVDYNPNRVTIRKKTSVFLITYATELKEFWEKITDIFLKNVIDKNLGEKVYRNAHFAEKLKVIPLPNLKGAWAKGPLNL